VQVLTDLIIKAGSGTPAERLQSATQLAALLEAEEARYQDVVGGPALLPNQRAQFSIGKALAVLKVGRASGFGKPGTAVQPERPAGGASGCFLPPAGRLPAEGRGERQPAAQASGGADQPSAAPGSPQAAGAHRRPP
jgi:hypothetical protein